MEHPLFVALSRPAMLGGVTLQLACIEMMTLMLLVIWGMSWSAYLLLFACHGVCWLICRYDPGLFDVLFQAVRFIQTPQQKTKGCPTYAPF